MNNECSCGKNKNKLLYACSGAANTGYLSDRLVRELSADGKAKMTCISAVAAGLKNFIENADISENIVIDGCDIACGKKIFDNNNLLFKHFILTDFGVEKGKTEITENVITTTKNKLTGLI